MSALAAFAASASGKRMTALTSTNLSGACRAEANPLTMPR
jgi:hypothetical protein